MNEKDIFVYRHRENKDVYLIRKYACVGGSKAEHFYQLTNDFREAVRNVMSRKDDFDFECHLNTPYSFNGEFDDTLPIIIEKNFEFDGYKGTAKKEVRYHLCDFEKVYFREVPNE